MFMCWFSVGSSLIYLGFISDWIGLDSMSGYVLAHVRFMLTVVSVYVWCGLCVGLCSAYVWLILKIY